MLFSIVLQNILSLKKDIVSAIFLHVKCKKLNFSELWIALGYYRQFLEITYSYSPVIIVPIMVYYKFVDNRV